MIPGLMTNLTMILDLITKVNMTLGIAAETIMLDMLAAITTELNLTLALILDMIIDMVGTGMTIVGQAQTRIRHYTKMGTSIIVKMNLIMDLADS